MAAKRKRVVLTMADKVRIVERLHQGVSGTILAAEYGVGTSTISDIKKHSEAILDYVSELSKEGGNFQRKTMKKVENKNLESTVYYWFLEQNRQGNTVTGPMLCNMALLVNDRIGGNPNFKATSGWLKRFRSRHGIVHLNAPEETGAQVLAVGREIEDGSMADGFANESRKDFGKTLREIISTEEYDMNNVYNVSVTCLCLKQFPPQLFPSSDGKKCDAKASCDHSSVRQSSVMVLLCANATGTHRLPLFLIGTPEISGGVRNFVNLPLFYKDQKESRTDHEMFVDWYDSVFIPEVKQRRRQISAAKTPRKVLLVLDGSLVPPSNELFERENGNFRAIFLPFDVTSPLESGAITCFKKFYKMQCLERVLLQRFRTQEPFNDIVMQSLNLRHCAYLVADAWDSVPERTLKESWSGLLCDEVVLTKTKNDKEVGSDTFAMDLVKKAKKVRGFENLDAKGVRKWLDSDTDDRLLLDETSPDLTQTGHVVKKEPEIPADDHLSPSHEEALGCLETVMKWCENQQECDKQQLLFLKRIRDMAARKQVNDNLFLT